MRDIRWNGAPAPVTIDISGLFPGTVYEIQLLFNEGADRDRHWDIGVEDELVFVHTHAEKYMVNATMAELESRLNPQLFFRSHRSSIVNLNHIKEIVPWFGGKYKIIVGDEQKSELVLSRARAKGLRDILPW